MKLMTIKLNLFKNTIIALIAAFIGTSALISNIVYAQHDTLQNGVPVEVPSVFGTAEVIYKMVVPKESASIMVILSSEQGGGDADLYVRKGSLPTNTAFDCRSANNGNDEFCNLGAGGGTFYIRVRANTTISGVTLTGFYSELDLEKLKNRKTVSVPNVFGTADLFYKMIVPANSRNIKFKLTGYNNADLYVKRGSLPTDTNYDCRPQKHDSNETCVFASGGGTYYIRVYAVTTIMETTLTGSFTK